MGTFDCIGPNPNKLLRYSANGKVVAERDFGGVPLLGLAFDAASGKMYFAKFVLSKVQRVTVVLQGTIEGVANIPDIGAPADRLVDNPGGSQDTIEFGTNFFQDAMTFDRAGNLYVSISFQGALRRIDNAGSCASLAPVLVTQNATPATRGYPAFGANGLAFNADESALLRRPQSRSW